MAILIASASFLLIKCYVCKICYSSVIDLCTLNVTGRGGDTIHLKVGFTQHLLRRRRKKKTQQFYKHDIDSAIPWALKGVRLSISVLGWDGEEILHLQ